MPLYQTIQEDIVSPYGSLPFVPASALCVYHRFLSSLLCLATCSMQFPESSIAKVTFGKQLHRLHDLCVVQYRGDVVLASRSDLGKQVHKLHDPCITPYMRDVALE